MYIYLRIDDDDSDDPEYTNGSIWVCADGLNQFFEIDDVSVIRIHVENRGRVGVDEFAFEKTTIRGHKCIQITGERGFQVIEVGSEFFDWLPQRGVLWVEILDGTS